GGGSVGLALTVALAALMLGRRIRVRKFAKVASVSGLLLGTGLLSLLPSSNVQAEMNWDSAQSRLQERGYATVSFYQAMGSQGSSDFVNGLESDGIAVDLAKYEESRNAWQIGVGYRYHDWMAVEVGYLDLGETEVNLDSVTGTVAEIEDSMSEHYPVSGKGWTVSNRFLWQAMPDLTLSAEVGGFIWEGEVELSGAPLHPDLEGGTDLLLGVAAGYSLSKNLDAVLHLKRIFFDEQEVDLMGIEGRLHF
ncbi:MAG TPA: hypothetical protein VM553_02115, partial [Dongiaceae bacterium]|nr:hypothetical protein [Dongiaceae bacterium]